MKLEEQEIVVATTAVDDLVYIYTTIPKYQRKLVARGATLVSEGNYTLPKAAFDPLGGFKRKSKPMTEEQRQAAAERLRKAREQKEVG